MLDREPIKQVKKGVKDIRDLLGENIEGWSKDQVEASRQTLNAVEIAIQIAERRRFPDKFKNRKKYEINKTY